MDIVSLVLQGTGGGLSASSSGSSQVGVDVAMAGLILQVIMLVAFSICFIDYMTRYLLSKETRKLGSRDKLFFTFLAVAVLSTLARCIFRADELKEGYSGELIKHEDLFIGLEGV
jgi:Kef-type K+ transport system membrane component KefB